MAEHLITGEKGEDMAAFFLQKSGYDVVGRNYRSGKAEIDLIIRKNDWLIFVEVKTRSGVAFGYPESFVSPAKAALLKRAAEEYIFAVDWKGPIRFDIVSIILSRESAEIRHFEDAIP
ncbi:MAG: YraN family protein [Siphonobacter aquaeclarae]|nr:YraN family protein [Siphonobacter aquaeclarae]